MKILITGATGFLGGHIVRRLLRDGHTVRILRRESSIMGACKAPSIGKAVSSSGFAGTRSKLSEFAESDAASPSREQSSLVEDYIGDITDPDSVAKAMVDVDAVIHAAAKISYWPQDAADTMHVNAYGTQCVANAALEAGVKRFVYVSSVMAVGIPDPGKLGDETLSYNFNAHPNPYSDSKHAGELFLQDVVARGLSAVTVNPGAIIGALDRRRAVGGLFFPGRINRYFYISGGMSAVDVDDVVDGIVRAMETGRVGERYLLTGDNISYRRMREVIAEEMGEPKPFIPIPTKLLQLIAGIADLVSYWTHRRPRISRPMAGFLPFELYYTSKKAQEDLGWTYRPFRDSVKSAVAWYKSATH